MQWPMVSRDPERQRHYETMRANGESHNIAEILATGETPHGKTADRMLFMDGAENKQFENENDERYYRESAERAGVSTTGKIYQPGLARHPADPRAWVSDANDILRIAREDNLTVSGVVRHKAEDRPPLPGLRVAPDLVEEQVARLLEREPQRAERLQEAREQIADQLTPAFKRTDD
jgi:hypothetical protein